MKIRFTKAHGASNDFLLTWQSEAPEDDHAAIVDETVFWEAAALADRDRPRRRGPSDSGSVRWRTRSQSSRALLQRPRDQ